MKMKKTLAMMLAMILVVSATPILTLAATPEKPKEIGVWEIKADKEGDTYLSNTSTGEELVAAFTIDESGNTTYLDLAGYADQLNAGRFEDEQIIYNKQSPAILQEQGAMSTLVLDPVPAYYYTETRTYVGLGAAQKVSPDYKGTATITLVNSVTTTNIYGGSASAIVEATNKIKLGASFNWNTSSASSTSVSGAWPVPAGKTGYIQFTPRLNVSVGNVLMTFWVSGIYKSLDMGESWGASPVKAGSFTDGIYELILR